VGGPELASRRGYNADPDVVEPGVDEVLIVGRAVHKRLEQLVDVIDAVHANVLTEDGPLGGHPTAHIRAVSQPVG
jgi:hypothetical protein